MIQEKEEKRIEELKLKLNIDIIFYIGLNLLDYKNGR